MSNAFLSQQRAPLFAELQQKPWLMNWLASIGESENSGKPLGILEAMFNRATLNKQSLEQAARSSFWGARTVQRLQSDIQGGSLSPKAVANAKDALDQIKAGSNVTQGATDQGMVNEIKSPFKINVDGEYFGDMDNGAFRARQQAAAAQAGPVTGTQTATTAATPPAPTAPTTTPAPAQTASNTPDSPSFVPRTGVGGLGAGSRGAGGINIPAAPGANPQLANVTPALREMLAGAKAEFEARNPGYTIAATSGARPGGPSSSQHATGNAIDMQIIGPNGQALANSGDDPTGLYHQYARLVYAEQQANHPELNGKLAWGGAFGTQLGGGGAPDLMHFDLGGERGHWTMNRPSQMGPLALQLAGATNVADQADQAKQGPGFGPPIPPGTTVQNGQLYRAVPSGTGDAYQPGRQAAKGGKGGGMGSTAQSRGQGGLYIPILSDIAGMFAGNYPGRPGLKGGYMQPAAATAAQPYQPGAPVPAGPAVAWDPKQQKFVPKTPPSAPPAPPAQPPGPVTQPPQGAENIPPYNIDPDASRNQPVPAQTVLRPNMPLPTVPGPLSVTDYLNPQNSTRPPPAPSAPPVQSPMPGDTTAPVTQAPQGAQNIPPYNMAPDASRNAPVPSPAGQPATPAPATPVASGATRFSGAPQGILQRLGIITPANAGELPPGPSAAAAVAQVQGGTPADFAGRFAGTPTDQRWMSNINTASGRGLAPGQLAPWPGSQPGGGLPSLPSLVGGPAGGTTTVAGIPLPNPRPQMPSGPPVQMAGSGIPVPRPRPQMPAVPPQQIPQPQGPVPAQAPPAVPPPPLPQNLGGTQMPQGARPGVRMLDAVPLDYRSGPPQAASFAERFANAPGQPGAPPIQNPGMAAALASVAARPQMTSQGGPVPPAGPEQPPSLSQMNADATARTPQPASFAARFAGAPAPAQFSAMSAFTPGNRGASIVPSQATPANQDDINAAILDYLRRQQQSSDASGYYGTP